jgi:hypothetical protein
MKRLHASKILAIGALAGILVIHSCTPDNDLAMELQKRPGQIVLGKKLRNPFSVENMRAAYQNMRTDNSGGRSQEVVDVRVTHLYVRFLPANYDLYDILVRDTTIYFSDHPLDHEIEIVGHFYHDPSIPENLPTYQYAAVPVDYAMPAGIAFEILDELYLPKKDPLISDGSGKVSSKYELMVDELEYEALRITDNIDDDFAEPEGTGRTQALLPPKWRPAGNIQLWDDAAVGSRPVVGAKVNATRFFEVVSGLTDNLGNFVCDGEFRYDANYSIKWERADFDIRSGDFGQAVFNGPNMKGNWNLTINSGLSRMYAIVHQGAHDYYYGNRLTLKSPPLKSFWTSAIKIAVHEEVNGTLLGEHCKDCRVLGVLPRLDIWNGTNTVDVIYSTIIHELGHASHWELRRGVWNDTETIVKESWAAGIQVQLTRLRYPTYVQNYGGDYTGVVEDMIDGTGGYDQVTGYTVRQIEDVMVNTGTWDNWRINIENAYANPTEANLLALFNFW